jgi:hypothetical protein
MYGSVWTIYPYALLTTPVHLLAQFFWVNWAMFLVNVVLCGFPLDGAYLLRSALWPHLGYRKATHLALFVGFLFMFLTGLVAVVFNELLVLCLAVVIYVASKQEWIAVETSSAKTPSEERASAGHPVNIVLPAAVKQLVDEEVQGGGFASPSALVLHLLQEAQQRKTTSIKDPLLREGLKS